MRASCKHQLLPEEFPFENVSLMQHCEAPWTSFKLCSLKWFKNSMEQLKLCDWNQCSTSYDINFQSISCSLGLGMEDGMLMLGTGAELGLFQFLCNVLIASRKQTGTLETNYSEFLGMLPRLHRATGNTKVWVKFENFILTFHSSKVFTDHSVTWIRTNPWRQKPAFQTKPWKWQELPIIFPVALQTDSDLYFTYVF